MVFDLYRSIDRMKKEILVNIINDNNLDKFQKFFLSDMSKLVNIWKEINDDLMFMLISKKTEKKIYKILNNIGKEMIQIFDLMIKENNK